jgi:hypothetical protein
MPEDVGIVNGLAQLSFVVRHEPGQVAAEHGPGSTAADEEGMRP